MQGPAYRQVVGVFRDRGQAQLASAAARRSGLEVGAVVEDAAGFHLFVRTSAPDEARELLLDYGAYRAEMG